MEFGTIFMAMGGWPIWEILLGNSPGMQRRWQDLSMACVHADTQNHIFPLSPSTGMSAFAWMGVGTQNIDMTHAYRMRCYLYMALDE